MNSRYLLLYVFTIVTAVSSVYSNPVIDDSLGTQPYTKQEHHDISIPEREHLDPTLLHPARVHARAVVPKKTTKKQPVTQVRKTTTKKQKPGPPLKKTPIEKKPSTTTTTTTKAKSCPLKPGAKPGEVQKPGTTTPQKQKTNRLAARTLRLSKRTVAKGQKVYDLLQSKRKAKVDKMTLAELKAKFDEKCYFRLPTEGKEAVFDEHIADLVNGGEQLASEEDGWVVSVISNTCNPWTGNPKEKNAQKYANSFHPRNGVIVAQNNDHGEQGTNSGLTWSDLAYMDYADAAAAQDVAVSGLTMVLRDTITNPETKATLSKMRMDGCLKKDINNVAVLTYEQDREYFLELLGSTNGVGVAYLLADFAGSFNGKNIVRVHADTGGMHLVWEIK